MGEQQAGNEEKMKKLPIGIQTFRTIIEEKFAYVDKTGVASHLIDNGRNYFLSRPRRFGKSLFLDTLAEIFKGSKELFEGLYIHNKWDWKTKYPVIRISFGQGNFSSADGIEKRIGDILELNCEAHDIEYKDGLTLAKLIRKLNHKFSQQVVILIDEYDKPILDNITDVERATVARSVLRDFYGSIKECDEYIRFVFITGVSKFSKMNLFSGLNNLEDITIDTTYATITGYTQHDLETVFAEHLKGADMEMVKKWYNGYNYFGDPLYNPFDILLFISKKHEFRCYWWETGNPAFLIEKLKEQKFYVPNLENLVVSEKTLNCFDVEKIDLIALLWQTGYLTFAEKIPAMGVMYYRMCVPNMEVRTSLGELFLQYLSDINGDAAVTAVAATNALIEGNLQQLEKILRSLFAAIPYTNYTNNIIANYEGYYSSVIYTFFTALGFDIIAEDITNKGRIDLTIKTDDSIYIIEFKVDRDEPAIHQIKERSYCDKYISENKRIFMIGINFSSEEKNITDFQWERVAINT